MTGSIIESLNHIAMTDKHQYNDSSQKNVLFIAV